MNAARRLALLVLVTALGVLAFAGAPVLAVAAEAPTVEEESVSDVASSSATFQAQIDPRESETTYRFEYGPSEAYGASIPIPDALVGSGASAVALQAHPQGLQPHTTYHFRVVAVSVGGTATGADQSFTTQTAGGELTLLDGRQWELVSPPNKHGAGLEPIKKERSGPVQAAEGGGAIAYTANGPVTADPEGNRSPEMMQVFSERGPDGWETQDIETQNDAAKGLSVGQGSEYRLFSGDLSLALVQPHVTTPLSPEATERTPYLREDASGRYVPLVTAANTPPSTKFGGEPEYEFGDVTFAGATPDMSHVVLRSEHVGLTSTIVPEGGLYEWAAGRLQLVSVLPDGEPAKEQEEGLDGISDDGSRVFFAGAYMRNVVKGETTQLLNNGGFVAVSGDGSRVIYSSGGSLFGCEIVEVAGKPACEGASDLTVPENAGESVGMVGWLGASEDASYAYFVANGVLAPGATPGECSARNYGSPSVTCNIYVSHDGTTKFVAPLSEEDAFAELFEGDPADVDMRVSPNGSFLAFMSAQSLTGYDNRDVASGVPDQEVYLYDAEAEGGRGRLVCASCNPTGARPAGVFDSGVYPGLLVDRPMTWGGHWLAASVPGSVSTTISEAIYQPRYLSDSGRLFFDSADALVPQATNGVEDVYEYEPAGVSSCGVSSVVFSERSEGCVGLVSSGGSSAESVFMDASESGEDVFFLTSASLVPQDVDSAYDMYDAHVCSVAVPCVAPVVSPPACSTADSCRAAPLAQPAIFGAPASATFSGSGNLATPVSKPTVSRPPRVKAKRRARRRRDARRMGRTRRSVRAGAKRRDGR